MAVTCEWNKKFAEYQVPSIEDENVKCTIDVYEGNCLAVAVYKKKELCCFFNDEEHAKRMLGLAKGYTKNCLTEWENIIIDITVPNGKKLANLLIKANMPFKAINKHFKGYKEGY